MSFLVHHRKLICAAIIGLAILYVMPVRVMVAGRNDFAHFYIGGMLYGTPDIHSPEVNFQKQIDLFGIIMANSYFIRPTFYGFLLKPLSWLPYYSAYLVFQCISLLCVVLFLRTFTRTYKDLLPIALMSPPLIANFILGQDVTLLLGFLTIAVLLTRKGLDFAAGFVLAFCAIKIHLFLLVPVALLFHRRWRILGGGMAAGLLFAIIGLASGGVAVYTKLFEMARNPMSHPAPEIMPNLRGFVFAILGGQNATLLVVLWLCTAVVACYLIWKAETLERALAFALIGGLLVNFHSYMQDSLLLLIGLALLTDRYQPKYVTRWLTISVLPFLYVLLYYAPPYSGLFHLSVIISLIAAVRGHSNAENRVLLPATVPTTT